MKIVDRKKDRLWTSLALSAVAGIPADKDGWDETGSYPLFGLSQARH